MAFAVGEGRDTELLSEILGKIGGRLKAGLPSHGLDALVGG